MIKNFSNQEVIINKDLPSIFLAGPTMRNSTFEKSWRKEACNILEMLNYNGVVYIPEFSDDNIQRDYLRQTEWERTALINADIIIFYIPRKLPEMPGLTTNVEFGMYLARKPESVLLCCPEGSEKNRYLEWLYTKERPGKMIHKNLKELLEEAVRELEEK